MRVFLDAIGASELPDERVKAMEDAGVQVRWFNPLHPWQLEETNYRTHRKVIVIDGQLAFIGGAGLADHWRGDARNEFPRGLDALFCADGEVLGLPRSTRIGDSLQEVA